MSALLVATLLLPTLMTAPAAAFTTTDPTQSLVDAASPISVDTGSVVVTVTLKDSGGADVGASDGLVTLAVGGDATLGGVTDNTDGTYTATLSDSTAETVTVTAKIDGTDITDDAVVNFTAGALDHIVISPSLASQVANVGQTYTAEGFDQFNNSTGDETGTTTFSIGGAGSSCSVNVCKSTVAGAHTVTGNDGGNLDTATLNVSAAAADHLVAGGFTDPTVSGVSHTLTVTARDFFNNVATGYTGTVHITSSDGAAVLPSNHTYTGGDGGTHGFAVVLKTAGTWSITATDTGNGALTDDQTNIDVTPAAANHLVVSGFGDPIAAGTADTLTVTARDAAGNVDTNYTGTVHLTSSDGAAVLPSNHTYTGGDGGTHGFAVVLKTAGTWSITATDTGNGALTDDQTNIDVTPAAANHLVVSGFNDPIAAGTGDTLTVTARDAAGNVDPNYTGTVHLTSSDPLATLDGNHTYTVGNAGVFVFNATLRTAGDQAITATDTITPAINGTQSAITVTPLAATHFSVTGFADPTVSGASDSFTVTALDVYGNTDTNYAGEITFTTSDGLGTVPGDYTFVGGDNGSHTFSGTLRTVGDQSISATDTGTPSITGSQSAITVTPGTATHFSVSGYPSPTIAGVSHTFTVTALDAAGNTATGYTGIVHFTSSDGAANLPVNYTFTGPDAGVHSFSATFETVGSRSIVATDTVTASITGTQSAITVNPGAATHLLVNGFNNPTLAGASHTVTVTAQDAFDNTATGYTGTVAITSSDGAATLPINHTFTGGEAGIHGFAVTLNTTGTRTITATDTVTGTITGTQIGIVVNAATATHFSVTGYNDPTVAGVSHSLTVTALDSLNNTATGYGGTVHITSSDGAATFSADAVLTNGVGTFTGILRTVGSQTITATDTITPGINGAQSGIDVTPAAAASFTVSGFSSPATAGVSDFFNVVARDAFNNVATGYAGTVHFTSSDGAAVLPANSTLAAGTGTFSATLKTAGLQSLTATDTVSAGITGSQTNIDVDPAPASHFTVTGFTSPSVAGTARNFTVTALDAFNNTATGYTGTVHFTSTDLQFVLANYTFLVGDNGVHVFNAALKTAGTQSITATDTVTGSITGTQGAISITPAGAASLTVTGFADPTVAGASHSFLVTALDAFSNTATGYVGTVHFTSTDGSAPVLPANYTFTLGDAGDRLFSATLNEVGTQSITATDTITPSITGSQIGIDVTPGVATHFSVSGYSNPATAGASDGFTVTALDASDNVATGYAGTVHFTSSDGAAVLPADSTLTNGTALFSATFHTAGTQSITATDTVTGSITGSQVGIVVNPGATTHLRVVGYPSPTTAGVSHTFTVTARDAFENVVTGYGGTVHFTSSDAATPPANSTLVAGTGTFSIALRTAGTQSITATDTVTGSINGAQIGIVVDPATASHFTVTGFSDPATAGVSDIFVVTALDAFNNTDVNYTGTVHFTSSDSAATLPGNYTFLAGDNGVRSFTATLRTAGTRSITATDTVTASITGSQINIDVNAAAAATLTVTGFSNPTVAGVNHSLTVTAFDAFNNVANGYTGTVEFTSTDSQAVLPGDYTFVGGDNGTRVFGGVNLRTVGTQTITATDMSSSLITGEQAGIVVTPAAAASFSVTGYPSPTVSAVAHTVTVTALDAFDNTATGYAGTVEITSSDVAALLPADNTLTNGVGTFSVTLNSSGNQSITATDSVNGAITGSQVGIAINPGPVDHIVISPSATSIFATDSQLYLAEGFDAGNNDLGDFTSVTDFSVVGGVCVIPVPLGPNNECSAVTVGAHVVTGHQLTDDVSDTAILTILNSDPVAVDDTPGDILEDALATTINVTANDTDINLDTPLLISGATDGAKGTVVVNVDGSDLTYTPDADANGSDTFTYDLDDGNGGTATATVHITITPVNDAPSFTVPASAPTIAEQTSVSPKTVAGFASGMSAGPSDESAQVLSFTASNNATNLFAVQPSVNVTTGDLTYTPAVNRNGVATVTLTLHDTGGILNGGVDATAHTFTITITGSNHTPFAINDAFGVVSGSPATALPVLTNDNDANPDVGEVLHIVNVTQGIHGGQVVITGGGTGLTFKPKAGYIGTDFFTYRVRDGSLTSNYATVLVNVPKDTYKPVATAPVQTLGSQTMGTSTIKVSLTFGGTDRGSGIAKFEIWQSTDGHSYKKIKTTTAHSTSATLTLNHVYRFRVRAIDKKNNIGSYAYGPSFKFVRYQETSLVYAPAWATVNSSKYSSGHARTTSTAGRTATISTTGRTFAWIGVRGSTRGTADVYVDGVLKAHLNLSSTSTTYRKVIYSITFASAAAHSFQIVYTGPLTRRVDVDAIVVLR